MTDCPVCNHMKEVGWGVAGKRLWQVYGPDVLEVIDVGVLPVVEAPKTSIDEDFSKAIAQLKLNLS